MKNWGKALFGLVAMLLLQSVPISSQEEYSLEDLQNSKPNDPGFKVNVTACDALGYAMAREIDKIDEDGSPRKSMFMPNKMYAKWKNKHYQLFADKAEYLRTLDSEEFKSLATYLITNMTGKPRPKEELRKIWSACASPLVEVMNLKKSRGFTGITSSSDSGAHEKCINAKDYEGCIRVNAKNTQSKGLKKMTAV